MTPPGTMGAPRATRAELFELARIFLRLGATAFGGPAAHLALMEEEFVRRRAWLSREELLDMIGAAQLIPGPNSTEVVLLIGQRRAGFPGLLVAGAAFILPAAALVSLLAWSYLRYGSLPAAHGLMTGIQPVIIAIVAQALWGFARTALDDARRVMVAVAAAAGFAIGWPELAVLLAGGGAAFVLRRMADPSGPETPPAPISRRVLLPPVLAGIVPGAGAAVAGTAASPWLLFALFFKTGAALYGSGYVLLAFLRGDFVEGRAWLTEAQLLDAVAIGQFTPGPLFTSATFIGYLLGGPLGAAASTAGIFLPAFLLVAVSGHLIPRLRASPGAGAFLDGVNAASVSLMAVVTVQLARAAWVTPWAVGCSVAAWMILVRFRINSAWLILAGGGLGLILGR